MLLNTLSMKEDYMNKFHSRLATLNDLNEMLQIEQATWLDLAYTYSKDQLQDLVISFPEGQVLIVDELENIVAMCNSIRTNYDRNTPKSWIEISGQGWAHNIHDPQGDYVYGLNLASNPNFRNNGGGQLALQGLLQVTIDVGAKGFYSALRIPDYHKHQHIPVEEYILTKKGSTFLDSGLRLWERIESHNQKLEFIKAIPYMEDDLESVNWGVLVYWPNPELKLC